MTLLNAGVDVEQAMADATQLANEQAPAMRWLAPVAGERLRSTRGRYYRIEREIHEGAQGVVYEGRDTSTQRRVAIKILRGLSGEVDKQISRFDREVEALACIHHPDVVKVRDVGTANRCFFLVMDYVQGQPLDEYIAKVDGSLRERAALFGRICEATAAAHVLGVIHRDIKPRNIMVDSQGRPRVLDFGLAKFVARTPSTYATTEIGQFVGSLPWASPEQAEGRHDRVDTRSDVYSLGVLLHNMLTNDYPYPVGQGVRETLEAIVRADPTRPGLINPEVDAEIDTIVLTCLDKNPDRRYQSAAELARDVRRYLRGDPISAKRDSGWYMFKKTIRRHRAVAVTSALALFTLVGFSGSVFALWRQAESEQARAESAEYEARKQQELAQVAREQAEEAMRAAELAAERSRKVSEFLRDVLTGFDPTDENAARQLDELKEMANAQAAQEVALSSLLKQAVKQLESQMSDEPEVEAALRETIAVAYRKLGEFEEAGKNYRIAVERLALAAQQNNSAESARWRDVGRLLTREWRGPQAEVELKDAIAELHATDEDEVPQMVSLLVQLAQVLRNRHKTDEALEVAQRALVLGNRVVGESHPTVAEALTISGWLAVDRWKLDRAQELFEQALKIQQQAFGDSHHLVAQSLSNLGWLAHKRYDYKTAEVQFKQALKVFEAELGPESRQVSETLAGLAATLRSRRRLDEAEVLLRQALAIQAKIYGSEHNRVATTLDSLGWVLMEQHRFVEAEPVLIQALDLRRKTMGPENHQTAMSLKSLGAVYYRQKQYEAAEPLFREALRISKAELGAGHPATAMTNKHYAEVLRAMKRHDDAMPLYDEALEIMVKVYGGDHNRTAEQRVANAGYLLELSRIEEAVEQLTLAHEAFMIQFGVTHWRTGEAASTLGEALMRNGDVIAAEALLLEGLETLRNNAPQHVRTLRAIDRLAEYYQVVGDQERAQQYRRESQETRAERRSEAPSSNSL